MSCADRGETYEEEAAEVIERLRQLTRDIEPPPQLLSVVLAQGEPLGSPRRGWWATVRTQSERYGEMLRCTPPLIRWTLVTQSALALVLLGLLVWQAPWAPERFYQTLSNSSDRAAQQVQLRVVFADDMTAQELRALLTDVQGTIVEGPSPLGVYTVAVALSGDARRWADRALDTLRAHPRVRLAEVLPTR